MAAISTIILGTLVAAQTASTIVNDRKSAKAARKQGEFNAGIADEQAADAIARGEEEAGQSDANTRQLAGSQRAAIAASGVDVASGSAADVIANDKELGALDAARIRRNAAREARGHKLEGEGYRQAGKNAARSYNNHAFGTLLSGAAGLYGVYKEYGLSSDPGLSGEAARANDALNRRGIGSLIGTTPSR
jgi:hypothetical protein